MTSSQRLYSRMENANVFSLGLSVVRVHLGVWQRIRQWTVGRSERLTRRGTPMHLLSVGLGNHISAWGRDRVRATRLTACTPRATEATSSRSWPPALRRGDRPGMTGCGSIRRMAKAGVRGRTVACGWAAPTNHQRLARGQSADGGTSGRAREPRAWNVPSQSVEERHAAQCTMWPWACRHCR
jgi:hypothetical protein